MVRPDEVHSPMIQSALFASPLSASPLHPLDPCLAKAALVDVDATLFVFLGLFLALYVFLRFALFRPVLRVFEEREKRIEGAKAEAKEMQERAQKALVEYETFLREARTQGAAEKESLRQQGQQLSRELLDQVRKETASELAKGKAALHAELAKAQSSIDAEAATLAQRAAERLLGRAVAPILPPRTVQ